MARSNCSRNSASSSRFGTRHSSSKQNEIGLAELRLGAFGWLATFTLALGFVNLLYLLGLMRSPLLFALILPPTAFGVLIPILEALLEEHFGGEYAAYRARTSGLIPGIY